MVPGLLTDIPAHLSPLKESPSQTPRSPPSQRSSRRAPPYPNRRRHKKTSSASTVPDSSEDELLEKQPPPKVKKLPTPAESPRKSRMGPKKSALAQVSASQDEDE